MSTPPNREVALFSAALELPASERAAYVQEACADDPALRLRLESLLRVHEAAIPFLENPAPGAQGGPVSAEVQGACARLAGPSSTRSRRESSTGTSSPRMFWWPTMMVCLCPRSLISASPRPSPISG